MFWIYEGREFLNIILWHLWTNIKICLPIIICLCSNNNKKSSWSPYSLIKRLLNHMVNQHWYIYPSIYSSASWKHNSCSDSQMVLLTEGPGGIDFISATIGNLNLDKDDRGYTFGYCYSLGLSTAPLKWLQQIIAHLFSLSPNMAQDLVGMNKKLEHKPAFYQRENGRHTVEPPPSPTPISNLPKTYTLSTCKQLLMWCWDPQSREPGSGGFSRGYL